MPRRTHPSSLLAAFAVGLLLALGVAACGGGASESAGTLETPPLTVGTGVTLPSTSTTSTSTTTTTTDGNADTGGAADTGADTGGAVDTGGDAGGDTGGTTGGDTGGGTAPDTGGGGTTTPTQPANPGGASPNYDSFCRENPGAC
ncbi:MAG TPA: hypothetical protein VFS37_04040 [Conexibacter sp.]|nr:hypothetical protein [Conexibacter sp.]